MNRDVQRGFRYGLQFCGLTFGVAWHSIPVVLMWGVCAFVEVLIEAAHTRRTP